MTSRRRTRATRSTQPPPPDEKPALGWKLREWTVAVPCIVEECRLSIRAGVTHHKDEADPPRRAMCLRDYNVIRYDEEAWRRDHPSEEETP